MGRRLSGVLSGFFLLATTVSASAVSIVNPSFEDTSGANNLDIITYFENALVPGWSSTGGDVEGFIEIWDERGAPTLLLPSTMPAADGYRFVQINPAADPDPSESLSQLITGLTDGVMYQISLSLKGRVRVLTESGYAVTLSNDTDEWVKKTVDFVASGTQTNLRLRGRGNGAFVDWVDIQVIPEPGTGLLMLTGLALLASRRRALR